MKNEYRRLVIASLAATMIMGVSNMYGKAFADPAHCDQPGWPSCYKVGYDDGQGRSGPCPDGHSFEFCRGWNNATKSANYNSGYNHGWQEGKDDRNGGKYTSLSGGNNFCPEGHTTNYCAGFHAGYTASWSASQPPTPPQNLTPQPPTPPQNLTPQPPTPPQNLTPQPPTPPQNLTPQPPTPPQNLTPQPPTPPQNLTPQPYVNPKTNIGNNTQPSTPAPSPQQCGLGKTIGDDGECHYSIPGIEKACQEHSTICSFLKGLLLHGLLP